MNILLVIAEHPSAAEVVRQGIDPDRWRIVHRTDLASSEPLLVHGLAHACLLDLEPTVQALWQLDQARKWSPRCPIILCGSDPSPEWTEEAYLKGAFHVLAKPLRPRLFGEVLQRVSPAPVPAALPDSLAVDAPPPVPPPAPVPTGAQGISVLRGFSGILTHSLDSDALLKQFLLFLRELFGLNRAAIFLAQEGHEPGTHALRAASSLGISQKLIGSVDLSFDSGIGQAVSRTGRIVRRHPATSCPDPLAHRQFDMLGAEVAVPILDREEMIGIALLDARITGEALSNAELELLFHLLEQLGLALRNISLHEQLASNSKMLAGVLRELSSACVVIDRKLDVLHANKTARKYFPPSSEDRARDFGFEDLPSELGSRVYQVLHTGTALVNYRYEPKNDERVFNINVAPFHSQQDGTVQSVLLVADDLTEGEHLRRLEVEAAELRLIKPMSDRLSSEIGNAIVPIPVFAELLEERASDPAFRATMREGLLESSRRIERLVNQMRFLIGEIKTAEEPFALGALIEESYREALKNQPVSGKPSLKQAGEGGFQIHGDRPMLQHAFMEVFLNALQARGEPSIQVRTSAVDKQVKIEIRDSGPGFGPEAVRHATDPFYTTKTVGVGLGLTVARRVFEAHGGRIEIPQTGEKGGRVNICLPLANTAGKKQP